MISETLLLSLLRQQKRFKEKSGQNWVKCEFYKVFKLEMKVFTHCLQGGNLYCLLEA